MGPATLPGGIGIIGAGSIGIAFAIVFASAGRKVRIYDSFNESLQVATERIMERLRLLQEFDLLAESPAEIVTRIQLSGAVADAIAGTVMVLECTPESLEGKRTVLADLDRQLEDNTVLASTSSAFYASEFAGALSRRSQCLVIHPANPPYLIPVVEVIPAPFTAPEIIAATQSILTDAAMDVVLVRREITGFVYNRLQGALLREAYCLVRDGVANVAEIDALVREGLGLRWSIIGPFETADLNTRGGIEAHAERLGPAYRAMGNERGQDDPWTPELVADVAAQRRAQLPLERWEQRNSWRDRRLAALQRWRRANPE